MNEILNNRNTDGFSAQLQKIELVAPSKYLVEIKGFEETDILSTHCTVSEKTVFYVTFDDDRFNRAISKGYINTMPLCALITQFHLLSKP